MHTIDVSGSLHPFGEHTLEYLNHDMDESNDTKYYGYVAFTGAWIIQQIVTSTGAVRYYKGRDDYSTNWTARAGLTYTYFNLLF
jgi:hypothetical protein